MNKHFVIGKVIKVVGLKGQLKIMPTGDINTFKKLDKFNIDGFEENYFCEKSVVVGQFVLLKIKNLDTIEMVEQFKGHNIVIERAPDVNLEVEQYFVEDLIGSKIYDGQDNFRGIITNIENFGATDIVVFERDNSEFRVAMISGIFNDVNVKEKMVISTKLFEEQTV